MGQEEGWGSEYFCFTTLELSRPISCSYQLQCAIPILEPSMPTLPYSFHSGSQALAHQSHPRGLFKLNS